MNSSCIMVLSSVNKPFSKKYGILCHKGYTGKNEKQVGCYVNLVGVETFSDRHLGSLIYFVRPLCNTKNISNFSNFVL